MAVSVTELANSKGSTSQQFQPTATVASSWLASSFLREYTEEKSPQLELEVVVS